MGPVSAGRRTYLLDSTIRSFTGTGHGSNPQRRSFLDSDKSLKWADYPEITTVDEYFDLLERYQEANPCLEMEHRIFRLLFYAMTGDTFVWRMFLNFWMDIRMMGAAS